MERKRRRNQILEAARHIFAEKGYHQTSVQDIISASNIARGTFYLYFESKRTIFEELIDLFLVSILNGIKVIVRGPNDPPVIEQIRGNVSRSFALLIDQADMTRILLNQSFGLDRDFDRKINQFYDEVINALDRALRRGVKMDLVAPCDTRVIAYFILGGIKETAREIIVRGKDSPEFSRLVEEVQQTCLRGVLRKDSALEPQVNGRVLSRSV